MMKMNRKLYTQKLKVKTFLEKQRIKVESSSLYIQTLNSDAECSRNVIKQKIIVMKKTSNLFKQL